MLLFWWKRYDGNFKCSQAVRTLHIIQQDGCHKLWSSLCQCLVAQGSHRKVRRTDMQMGPTGFPTGNSHSDEAGPCSGQKSVCWAGLRGTARQGHSDRAEHGPGLAAPMAGTLWGPGDGPCHSITVWGADGHGGWWPRGPGPWAGWGSPSGQAGPVGALSVLVVPCSGTASHWPIRKVHFFGMC